MAPTRVRNPIAGFVLAALEAVLLAAVVGFVATLIPYLEFRLFFLGLALFGVGAFAGRKTYLGSLGFVGTYLGAFVGFYLSEEIFWVFNAWAGLLGPGSWMETMALLLALAAGLGGWLTGKMGTHRLDRAQQYGPGVRRCSSCGARVGPSAHKCWSCKATLMY